MSTEIINKALYSFPVKDDCTITPIVKPIPSFQTLEWPLSMHTDIDGKNTYLFQKSYDIIFPTWCEYVKVEMPIIKKNGVDAPLSTVSITSDSNVVWFDNTTETNKLVSYVRVTSYMERPDSNNVNVQYSLMISPISTLSSDKYTIKFTIGNDINTYCRTSLSSKDIISDIKNV